MTSDATHASDTGTVLVTGAGGFIGSHVAEMVLARGYKLRAFLRYTSTNHRGWLEQPALNDHPDVEFYFGDIRDPGSVAQAVQGCDYVLHLAALIGIPYSYSAPRDYVAVNIEGTINVLEAARAHGVKRIVHTSTSETYGTAQRVPIDETHPLVGQSPYSATKIGADKLAESYFRSFELPVMTLRPFNTYGPRQSMRAVIPTIINQLLAHPEYIQIGSLDPKRDFTFVEDTAAGFLAAMETPGIEGETLNLGVGKTISIGDLIEVISGILGATPEIRTTSERVRPEKSEVMVLQSDNRLAGERMGWKPEVGIEEGLRRTVEFFKTHPVKSGIDTYTV